MGTIRDIFKSFSSIFSQSSNKYLLKAYYVPGLGRKVKKTEVPFYMEQPKL